MRVELDDLLNEKGSVRKGYERLAADVKDDGSLHIPTIRSSDPELDLPSRDEYPFACTKEHAGKVWVGHVPPEQNSLQGNMIRAFLKEHAALDGFAFRVEVRNYPLETPTGRIVPRGKLK